jgi:lysophospholipase
VKVVNFLLMNLLLILLAVSLTARPFVFAQTAAQAYTPSIDKCPPNFRLIREPSSLPTSPQTLSAGESHYVQSRKSQVLPNAWRSYFQTVQGTGLFFPPYVGSILNGEAHEQSPTLGIAVSGGAYRAAIFGAGVMTALDGRNATSRVVGTGGLLQAATYVSGLSGGTWLISSLAQADFPTFPDLIFGSDTVSGWNAAFDILQPGVDAQSNAAFALNLVLEGKGKADAGFPVSFDDIWTRGLSRHFVQGTDAGNFFDASVLHGAGITFSGISDR